MKNTAKYLTSLLIPSLALSASFVSMNASAADPIVVPNAPDIAAQSYVLMDYHSGKILAEKNMDERRHPASLTKMLTSYVIGQELKSGAVSRCLLAAC